MEKFIRSKILLGEKNMDILTNAHILVVGIGGVGGYVCEMLARTGIENFTLVDFDKIEESNINRQIIATEQTIGLDKVEVMKERILQINSKCRVEIINKKFEEKIINEVFNKKYDYVIDAIDDLKNKILLCKEAQKQNLKIISSMGVGNRIGIPNLKICDVYKTYNDGLARKFRKMLKENDIKKLDVLFIENQPLNKDNLSCVGSMSYVVAISGATIAGYVINNLIKE